MVALTGISPGFSLATVAGGSYQRMRNAGMPAGGIRSAYRSEEDQQELYDGWIKKLPGYNLALPPYKSMHVRGLALDMIESSSAHKWMLKNAARFGWRLTALPIEPWHWEYTGVTTSEGDDDMPLTEQDVLAVQRAIFTASVNRGEMIPLFQDWADTGSIARDILEKVEALKAPAAPVIDYDRLATLVAEKMANAPQKTVTIEVQASRKVV